jgi:TRAP transporter TAXI family solute receptor
MRRFLGALAIACLAWATLAERVVGQPVLGLGTMAPGTLSYGTGSAIAEMMVDELGLETRVQPSSGESTLLALLDAGELDFAIANALEAAEAQTGKGSADGRPLASLRVAAVLYPLRVGLFVRADSGIETIRDLAGKRVTAAFSASAAIATLLDAALAGGGLTLADVTPVPVPNVVAGADQFVDGRVDAFFFAVGAAKVAEVDAGTPLRLLPLEDTEEARARVTDVFAEAYIDTIPPVPGFAGVTAPSPVLAFDNLLLTSAAVSGDVVGAVVRGLVEHRDELVSAFAPFRGLAPERLHKPGLRVPYHEAMLAWAGR